MSLGTVGSASFKPLKDSTAKPDDVASQQTQPHSLSSAMPETKTTIDPKSTSTDKTTAHNPGSSAPATTINSSVMETSNPTSSTISSSSQASNMNTNEKISAEVAVETKINMTVADVSSTMNATDTESGNLGVANSSSDYENSETNPFLEAKPVILLILLNCSSFHKLLEFLSLLF